MTQASMADSLDDGLPFEIGDLWRPSAFLDEDVKTDSLFDLTDTKQSSLDLDPGHESAHFAFDNQGEIGLPSLTSLDFSTLEPSEVQLTKLNSVQNATVEQSDDGEGSIWDIDLSSKEAPRLCTWESFSRTNKPGPARSLLLSEAGPRAFDAALKTCSKSGVYSKMIPQDAALRALCHLSLGRSSVFFQWSDAQEQFNPVLDRISISGLTMPCSEGFVAEILEYGTLIVKLRRFAEARFASNVCPSILALRSCVASISSATNQVMAAKVPRIITFLRLQQAVAGPRRLLSAVWSAVKLTLEMKSNIDVISAIADYVYNIAQAEDAFNRVWRALLTRVSMPWLEALATDLGLDNVTTSPEGMAGVEETQESSPTLLSPSNRRRRREGRLTFIRPEDKVLIDATKACLNLIRNNMPAHPLSAQSIWGIQCPVNCLYECAVDQKEMMKNIDLYKTSVLDAMTGKRHHGAHVTLKSHVEPFPEESDIYSNNFQDGTSQEGYLNDLIARMSTVPNVDSVSKSDDLYDASLNVLQSYQDQDRSDMCVSNATFNILDQAMPLIMVQYRLANGAMIRHLFRDCRLRQHLELQRSFQLMQNGDFVDRLSTALFRSDVQSAERRRGVIPTGQKMGLRLGTTEGQRWPPASSELQLTLMGILSETYKPRTMNPGLTDSEDQLPGDLSFAIRELPEEDIERVLDANSIFALDFLRLQYSAPPPLDAVLTADILRKYDDIFRFLLVLLRLIHVVTELRIQISLTRISPAYGDQEIARRPSSVMDFALEAHHFVYVFMTFTMDVGINASWRKFVQDLELVERSLQSEDDAGEIMTKTAVGIESLRQLHDECLERIRSSLFLRKKQQGLRDGVNAVFSSILSCAARLPVTDGNHGEFDAECANFVDSMSRFRRLLQEIIDKPLSSGSDKLDAGKEADAIRILLLQLRWRDHS